MESLLRIMLMALAIPIVYGSSWEQKTENYMLDIMNDCVGPKTRAYFTPLCTAAAFGQLEIAELLVEKGADIYITCDKRKPLHVAAAMGQAALVEFFVQQGQDVDDPDENMCTALHYASRAGQLDIIKLVLDKGANINAQNVNGNTPLHLAVIAESDSKTLERQSPDKNETKLSSKDEL